MTDALLNNAYRAHQKGNRNEAVRLCREVLRQDPNNFNALYLLGFVVSALVMSFAPRDLFWMIAVAGAELTGYFAFSQN